MPILHLWLSVTGPRLWCTTATATPVTVSRASGPLQTNHRTDRLARLFAPTDGRSGSPRLAAAACALIAGESLLRVPSGNVATALTTMF